MTEQKKEPRKTPDGKFIDPPEGVVLQEDEFWCIEDQQPRKKFPLPAKAQTLLGQILDAYPDSDEITLRKVMGLGKVIYCDDEIVPGMAATAAVMNTKPYTLIFGKKFMQENMRSMEDCVYILSHELTHLVLDHFAPDILAEFKSKELGQKASHIIVDCQVNATVYNSLKEDKYLEFIKRYYPKGTMPYCFFRPDGEPDQDEWVKEKGYEQRMNDLHRKLYSEQGISNSDLIEGLMPWFEDKQNQQEMAEALSKLLGNHSDTFKDRAKNAQDESLEELTKAVARDTQDYLDKNKGKGQGQESKSKGEGEEEDQSSGKQPGNGKEAGEGENIRERDIKVMLDRLEYANAVKRQLKKAEVISPSSRIFKAIDEFSPKRSTRSPVPNFFDRRTAAFHSMGLTRIFHNHPQIGSKVIVPCYLDVSGSQDHVLPVMLPVVTRLKQKIGNFVYCFSTQIDEARIADLQRGKYKSTGGTDFNPVAEHILKNNFKNALILTDGHAYLDPKLALKLKKKGVNITVGWTESNPARNPLSGIARKEFYVFGDEDKGDF